MNLEIQYACWQGSSLSQISLHFVAVPFFNIMAFECVTRQDERAGGHENESRDSLHLVFWL